MVATTVAMSLLATIFAPSMLRVVVSTYTCKAHLSFDFTMATVPIVLIPKYGAKKTATFAPNVFGV
jgi:hypothetical protein